MNHPSSSALSRRRASFASEGDLPARRDTESDSSEELQARPIVRTRKSKDSHTAHACPPGSTTNQPSSRSAGKPGVGTSNARNTRNTSGAGLAPSALRSDTLGRAILAIERGDTAGFRKLVPKHVPVDSISSQGRSLAAIASFHKQQSIVDYINQQLTGRVIRAIETGDIAEVKKFVPGQVQANACSSKGRSLWKIADYHGKNEIRAYLEAQLQEDGPVGSGSRRNTVDVIRFYNKRDGYYAFTNFYQGKPIVLDGQSWKTAEHYFQAQKFTRKSAHLQETVRNQRSAREAFKFARQHDAEKRSDWDQAKDALAQKVLRAKFVQDEDLKRLLCDTGDAHLVEDSPVDAYWGCGADGTGRNMLGKLLMELRAELQKQT